MKDTTSINILRQAYILLSNNTLTVVKWNKLIQIGRKIRYWICISYTYTFCVFHTPISRTSWSFEITLSLMKVVF